MIDLFEILDIALTNNFIGNVSLIIIGYFVTYFLINRYQWQKEKLETKEKLLEENNSLLEHLNTLVKEVIGKINSNTEKNYQITNFSLKYKLFFDKLIIYNIKVSKTSKFGVIINKGVEKLLKFENICTDIVNSKNINENVKKFNEIREFFYQLNRDFTNIIFHS
ncbi:MAG: hypothetical protein HeimC3_46280 [Candidatus Heimdallarchaeota archaeon LC_3]|nr:MAG: hypothetical protein HeimC3_46280 [Candidatus Heimdallarchaeota archaeon LC_3]